MARRAAQIHGADWGINNDDDEFWRGRSETLRDVLARIPPDRHALSVERFNHPPMRGLSEHGFLNRMVFRERSSRTIFDQPLPPKVCHRAFADIEVSQGNHAASRFGLPLAAAPADAIAISHFPIRDFASFERKIVVGGAAYARNSDVDPDTGATWRRLYQIWREGGLRDWYDSQVLDCAQIADGLARGDLVTDDAVALTLSGRRRAA